METIDKTYEDAELKTHIKQELYPLQEWVVMIQNIKGLSDPVKQMILTNFINQEEIDIAFISEINLTIQKEKFIDKHFEGFQTICTNSKKIKYIGHGVMIVIIKEIAKHIYHKDIFEGFRIAIKLSYKEST